MKELKTGVKSTVIKVKVNTENRQKMVKPKKEWRMLFKRCCGAALEHQGLSGCFEVNITFVDNNEMETLNKAHRGIEKPTDVLSFPMSDFPSFEINPENGNKIIGDIVISLEKAEAQAYDYMHSSERELAYLTVHSMLHMLGHDHVNGGLEKVIMREAEEQILTEIGYIRIMEE